jgi:hypothetical protein
MALEHLVPPAEPPINAVKKGIREGGVHPRASSPNLTIVPNESTRIGPWDENYHPRELTTEPDEEVEEEVVKPTPHRRIGRRATMVLGIAGSALAIATGTQVVSSLQEVNNQNNTAYANARATMEARQNATPAPTEAPRITHVIEQQTAYQETQQISKAEVEKKYNIRLLNQHEADVLMGISDSADIYVQDWTDPELHWIDQNLANTPPNMIAEYNGIQLSISIGSLSKIPTHEIAGSTTCADNCGGNYSYIHDLMNLSRGSYDANNTVVEKQGLVDHELGHRVDFKTLRSTKPDFEAILGDMSYMQLPQFAGTGGHGEFIFDDNTKAAIDVLKSFAGGESNPKSPHQIFVEGVAQACGLYAQWDYHTFVTIFGQFLDGELRPDGTYSDAYVYYLANSPLPDSELREFLPNADAFFRLIEAKFFGGDGYDPNNKLIKGSDAIPAQTIIPIPTQQPIDGGNVDPGMINNQDQDVGAPSPTESPVASAPGIATLDGKIIGTIGGPSGNRRATSRILYKLTKPA